MASKLSNRLSRRKFVSASAIALSGAIIAACAPEAAAPAPAQPAQKDPLILQVWNHQSVEDPNRKSSEQRFAQSFQPKHPHVSLQWEQISGGEMVTKLRTACAAGTPPDVAWTGDWLVEFVENKWAFPAPDSFQARVTKECYETAWRPGTIQGKLYGSPSWYSLSPGYIMANEQLAAEAGLDLGKPPTDWAGLAEWGRRAAKWEGGGMTRLGLGHEVFTGATPARQYPLWMSKLWSAGGELLNADLTKALFESDAGVEAIRIARHIILEAKACSPGFVPDNEAMYANRAVMWVANTSWGAWLHLTVLKQDEKGAIPKELLPTIRFRYFALPKIRDSIAVASPAYWSVMARTADRQQTAWALLEDWYNQYQEAKEPVGAGNYVPWHKGQAGIEPWKSDPQWQVALKAAATSKGIPFFPKAAAVRDAVSNELWEAIMKQKDPKQALKDAATAVNRILAEK